MVNKSLKEKLIEFLITEPKHLAQIYNAFPYEKCSTIRGRLNEHVDSSFKRISRGVYLAVNGTAKALIIEGDTWEVIKEFDDNSVDAIITDSGYTCLNKHYQVGSTRKRNVNKHIGFETKDIDEPLMKEMFRILKPGGHFFNFLPADGADTLAYNNDFIKMGVDRGFVFNKRFIWNKINMSMGYNGRNTYEQMIFFSKGKRHMPYDLSVKDVLSHKRIHHSKRIHDAEKPLELIKEIMKFCSKKGDVVLDPFAGSLKVAYAGLELNRNTICIEIDNKNIRRALI